MVKWTEQQKQDAWNKLSKDEKEWYDYSYSAWCEDIIEEIDENGD